MGKIGKCASIGVLLCAIGFFLYSATNEPSFVIDVVYTWVDGNDPEWQKMRAQAARYFQRNHAADGNAPCRFRDRNELKYSLRSVWKFAPFVNHIYIVTCGQIPKWFKPHPKITFVHHKDIFLNKADLPTFNSHAIEAHLHRIPGLSEYFVYFNDDVFLGKEAQVSDFFSPSGQIRFRFRRTSRYGMEEWLEEYEYASG